MKRLVVLTPVFPYPKRGVYTGIERHVEGLCSALSRKSSLDVQVITSFWNDNDNKRDHDEINRVSIHRVSDLRGKIGRLSGFAELDFLSLGFNMYLFLKAHYSEYDYLIYNFPFPFSRLLKNPSVAILHHVQPMQNISQMISVPFGNAYFKVMKTDLYIAPSQYTADAFERCLGIERSRIEVISEGVDPKFAQGNPQNIRNRIGEGRILLFVGNLMASKGVIELLHVFKNVLRRVNDVVLVNVVEGPIRNSLIKYISSMNLGKKVFVEGFVSDDLLPDYYAACDLFVSLSSLEGFGLTFVEAMMAGKPIVAFDIASVGEVVGDAGLLAKPFGYSQVEEYIVKFLTDENFRIQKSLAAKERSKSFTWENSADTIVNVLESL